MRKDTRMLKERAISSLRRSAQAFNGMEEDGRVTSTLLHAQHAFEMLLKGALVEKGVRIFDPSSGRSIGFNKCLNLAREKLGLSDDAVGVLRVVDALRDDEQHYMGGIDERILFLHMRAAITLFDDILQAQFHEHLAGPFARTSVTNIHRTANGV